MHLEELRTLVEAGEIDTVVVAFTDMQGRLQGKRCHARHFLDDLLDHPTEGCNYLLAVDVEMNTVGGFAMASWEQGYGDFVLAHDMSTLRRIPWWPGSVLVQCDLRWLDGTPVVASPRQVLRRQIDRLAEHGLVALAGTELEFMVFATGYDEAARLGYRNLRPSTRFNVDYALTGTTSADRLLRRIRNEMTGAGMKVESSKGECNLGQFEVAFRYDQVLRTADNHAVYKAGAKEIAAQEGQSLTFMAKFDEREGSSCHIHLSVRDAAGAAVMAGAGTSGLSPLGEAFLAGQLATLRDLTLLFAPNVNSYKRYQPGTFAPTAAAWGRDNRTCALRVVGEGHSLRVENRVPGGDANPYLALAAVIAGGLHGVEAGLGLPAELVGNAYLADLPHVPATLRDAAELFEDSPVARTAFGDEVVDHYVNAARVELSAFDRAVTDWERVRSFERM
jgi:glutamine synthetase